MANNNHTARLAASKEFLQRKTKPLKGIRLEQSRPEDNRGFAIKKSVYTTLNTTTTVESRIFNKRIFLKRWIYAKIVCICTHTHSYGQYANFKRVKSFQCFGTEHTKTHGTTWREILVDCTNKKTSPTKCMDGMEISHIRRSAINR